MSELAFCKSFLSALDARPSKLSSDHIADARQYPAQGAYTLPRLQHPPHPARPSAPPSVSSTSNTSSSTPSNTISLTLKPLKPTTPTIPIPSLNPSKTSIYDLKNHYATSTSLPASKIKILYKKKPVADSKTVLDVIGSDPGDEVEFGVMIMGGAAAIGGHVSPPLPGTWVQTPPAFAPSEADKGLASAVTTAATPGQAAVGPSGKEVVGTDEFWGDLKNFVMQRIKDEKEGERLVGVFKDAWEGSK